MSTVSTKTVIAYIDGFNLYRGMRESNLRHLLWLDLLAIGRNLCPAGYELSQVKYFTSRILNLKQRGDPQYKEEEASRKRQSDYLDALRAIGVSIFEGRFKRRYVTCRRCGDTWIKPEEKMSDVNLATQLLADAFRRSIHAALVVSGDADLVPPIRMVVAEIGLPVIVAFPPKRILDDLQRAATGVLHLNTSLLKQCQLPNEINSDGHIIKRPAKWTKR